VTCLGAFHLAGGFLTEEIGRGLLNINRRRRGRRVADDFTRGRRRCGLKSEILATRRVECERALLGVNHCVALSYVLLFSSSSSRSEPACSDLFLVHERVAAVSQWTINLLARS